jgi:hypothetical protein
MKILFLDIDGVLNHTEWLRTAKWGPDHIDPSRVALIQQVCDKTGAEVVISSTWRLLYPRTELCQSLRERGLQATIRGVTPDLMTSRGLEIEKFLVDFNLPVEGIAVVDDDSDMVNMTPWFVQTSFETGVTPVEVEKLIRTLNQPPPPCCKPLISKG